MLAFAFVRRLRRPMKSQARGSAARAMSGEAPDPSDDLPMMYGGFLRPATDASKDAPVVYAKIVPQLEIVETLPPDPHAQDPHEKALSGAEAFPVKAVPLPYDSSSSSFSSFQKGFLLPKTKNNKGPRSTKNLTYYVCTKCEWSGSSCNIHQNARPQCNSFPCIVNYDRNQTTAKEAVAAFLARCTPRQRELGLPPDYATPVRLPGPDGRIDPTRLFLSVPMDRKAGDVFEVPTGRGLRTKVTVPEGLGPGDILSIHTSSGVKPSSLGTADQVADDDEKDEMADPDADEEMASEGEDMEEASAKRQRSESDMI